jgi:2-keto-4-pentenoate hydratase/2-oxohepta-3-ene-1,7-dioic acid hydratase in catechol pathway
MRFASYVLEGSPSYGVVVGDKIYDLGDSGGSLRDGLADGLDELKQHAGMLAASSVEGIPIAEVSFLPVITRPAKIVCIGVNYRDHREETKRPEAEYPTVFFRFADTQVGHGQPAIKPSVTGRFDYEGELAVVIGKASRAIPEADAMTAVAGYSCYNDLSVRDWQRHTSQWGPGKNFPATGAFGPWLVTADEVPDPAELHLTTRVNGEERQSADVADLLFSIPRLISYVTAFTLLDAGDVLVTGTPGGVGLFRDPPTFLRAGDVIEVEISQIGTLRNVVAEETAVGPA